MLQSARVVLVVSFALVAQSFAGTAVIPTTTLAAEAGNNTSAANSFANSTNGNMGAGNVSKENVHKLLNAGTSAKIYAHFMAWWGSSSHINIGYDSANLTQVHSQISDMMSRGIDGLIVDWYGQGNTRINQASLYVKQDAETRGGKFEFAIMEDQGSVHNCAYTAGCDATQALINDLNYIVNTYTVSPAYMRINGQPVIFTFDVENLPNIDWTKVMANVQGNPKLVLRNNQGFTKWYTSGGYAWVVINGSNPNDWGQAYLDNFYSTSKSYPSLTVYPGTWKGFNDTAASWSQNRIMSQNCGQVWLQTFAELGKYFTGTQAQAIQLVTWNDYEEGTEIETGIDNCVSVSASATSAGDVSWSVSGQENTVDHYTVFISTDGQNLMKLADVAPGTHTYSLASFGFTAGNYTVFVEAIGKPSMRNKISAAVPVTLGDATQFAVNVASPANSSALQQSVHFVATTTSASAVTAMRIYVDNVSAYLVNAASIDTSLQLAPGSHYVVVQAWNQAGQIAKTPLNITVANQPPKASIAVTPATGPAPLTVTASTAASTDADGTIASSTIDFGDGTVANGPTASHTYNLAGAYTVKGTVKDNVGLTATSSTTVTVAAPVFTVNAVSPTDNSSIAGPVHFAATTTSGSLVTAMRVYVDNNSVYAVNAASLDTTLTLTAGAHYVVLQGWNQAGAVAKTPLHITVVNQPPSANLLVTPSSGMAPVLVSATASGTDVDGTITSMSIDFGDGTLLNGATGTHTYSAAGTYTVTAKITDNYGASTTAKSTVTVIQNGVTLTRPLPGAVVTSPVAITATAGAPNPIVAMRVYVDNMATYSLNSFSSSLGTLDTTLPMSSGLHNLVVQAWDSKGTVYKTSALITVQ
jgi:PKD repeat protein